MLMKFEPRVVARMKIAPRLWTILRPESLKSGECRMAQVEGFGCVAFTHAPKSGELAPATVKALKTADYVVCCYGNAVRNRYRAELPRVGFVPTNGPTLPVYSSKKETVLLFDKYDLIAAEEYEREFNSFMAMG